MRVQAMTTSFTWILILVGIILVLLARLFSGDVHPPLPATLLETLGVTVATVLTVKLIYEKLIAEEHFAQFQSLLKNELGNLENLTGTSLRLGILEEFATRSAYIERYSVDQIISVSANQSRLRCIGNSLFHVMNRSDQLERALSKGMTIELCLLGPQYHSRIIQELTGLYLTDIQSSLDATRDFLAKITESKPPGALDIRLHSILLWDSFISFTTSEDSTIIGWDLSFGRDLSDKRVFVLDAAKPLGQDLTRRYERLWNRAEHLVLYRNQTVEVNKLQDLMAG
jgi:hypothetical protein